MSLNCFLFVIGLVFAISSWVDITTRKGKDILDVIITLIFLTGNIYIAASSLNAILTWLKGSG
jgi:apolipoprotein N-acyltransferase